MAAGKPVSRAAVNFVLQGLGYAGVPLTDEVPALDLAAAWTSGGLLESGNVQHSPV